MSDTSDIQERVTDVVTDVLQTRVPSASTDLIEAGILDSLGFVELLARLEQEFGLRISLETADIDQFRSIESIAAFIIGLSGSAVACSR
jgi:acyl carrier protein